MVAVAETTTTRGVGEVGRARASVAAIETLARIRQQARTVATPEEREILSGWSGWGPLAKAFSAPDQTWADLAERIQGSMSEADMDFGLKGTYMSFYTPASLATAMWDMLRAFGYDGGPVAELGCGGGAFFGTAPDGVPLVGVERDPTSAAICELLHPRARVVNDPLEDTHLPSNFAAVVGNVPFGDVKLFDTQAPADVTGNVHNYFIWRAVQALAPGGYAILLTSRHTMDTWRSEARVAISADADFVGAVRLPNGALGGGTEATADVVVLRRKGGHKRETQARQWKHATEAPWDRFTRINQWWLEEPGAVLGTMGRGPTTAYGLDVVVEPDGKGDTAERLRRFTETVLVPDAEARNLLWTPPVRPEDFDAQAAGVVTKDGVHKGTMTLAGKGGVLVATGTGMHPLPNPKPELLRLLRLRDLAVELVTAEADHGRTDASIEPVRADVRAAYQDYVDHHGPLNRSTQRRAGLDKETGDQMWSRQYSNVQGFRQDPHAPLVYALEVYDDDDGATDDADVAARARPAEILLRRQNIPPQQRTRTDDPEQALAWCLDRFGGKVRIDYIAAVLGRPLPDVPLVARALARDEVAALLGDKVLLDPTRREWLTAEEYLSGDVRGKHRAAVTAAKHDQQFERNAAALQEALPKWLGPDEIVANLGTPWIGPTDIEAFIAEVIGYKAEVKRAGGKWEVVAQGALRHSAAASAEWGTPAKDAFELVQLALNYKIPTVFVTVVGPDGEERRVQDKDQSLLAAEKQQQIRARFGEWVWADPDRARRLEHLYNERFNNLRARQYDGSHVTIQGMAPWFKPYDHQLSFVARACATPASLCGHPVGAGKTNTMAMTAVKLKQIGLVNKPMMAVPNHLIEQVDREIRQLFPAAKILTGSAKTISDDRLAFTARCVTGDWDIVLVTHSAFNAMDVSAETVARYHEDLEGELRDGVVEGAGGKLKGRMVKQLAKALDRMKEKIQTLRSTARPKDAGVLFEQLGVDFVLLDEFHYYKNLAMKVATDEFSVKPSKRASDLDMKLRYLRERNHGGPHAALFSGTPISNTMLELYVCLHYTMRPQLREMGIGTADQWAAAFVQFVTSVEVTVDGGDFQMRTRPSLFVNAPELRVLLAESADIRTADQLGLKRPAADLHVVACEPTDMQAWFSSDLVVRAEDVRNRKVEKEIDNMLKICTDGRRMATDPALVDLADDGEHKLHVVAEHMIGVWHDNPGKVQIGFLDIGTPTKRKGDDRIDYQSYGRLRRMLTDAGMDVGRIRFIHDAKDDASRARLFRDCRRGKVDVILGSTDKLGVGTNIQKLVVAMHHIDAPFRPADVEQRDGRGLRPGNIHKIVKVFRYVMKRTFDAYMWQMLTRKLGFISQMLSGSLDRTVEDVASDALLSFGAIKAAATDQPLLQEKVEVEAELKKLTLKERAHRQTVARMKADGPRLRMLANDKNAEARAWEAIARHTGDVDLDDDKVVEQLHTQMGKFKHWSQPMQFGALTIGWRMWRTKAEESELQPLLYVNGEGAASIEERGYRWWKPTDVKRRLKRLLGKAAEAAAVLRDTQAKALTEAERCDELAARPFELAGELTTTRARLDRIEADLRAAATDREGPDESSGDVVMAAEPDLDALSAYADSLPLADLPDFTGAVIDELEDESADVLAGLMDDLYNF